MIVPLSMISAAVSPIFRRMIECYCRNLDLERIEIAEGRGTDSDLDAIVAAITDRTACVIVQYPNFFGEVEDLTGLAAAAQAKGALAVCSAYPVALGCLKTPGEMGFDIVTGEGQSLGIPLSFGGPYLGSLQEADFYLLMKLLCIYEVLLSHRGHALFFKVLVKIEHI